MEKDEILDLIGQNVAGKSSTFHSILGFIKYDGHITWHGQPINARVRATTGCLEE
nr:ATP-binding cassette domain-containing protein [Secundilactobacillus pentosiphilus]